MVYRCYLCYLPGTYFNVIRGGGRNFMSRVVLVMLVIWLYSCGCVSRMVDLVV